jgi:hypothetical protein
MLRTCAAHTEYIRRRTSNSQPSTSPWRTLSGTVRLDMSAASAGTASGWARRCAVRSAGDIACRSSTVGCQGRRPGGWGEQAGNAAHRETCLRHALLHVGYDIRTTQDLLGHADVTVTMTMTMTYTHVLKVGSGAVRRPVDSTDPVHACRRRATEHTEADRRQREEVAGRCPRAAEPEGRLTTTLRTFYPPGSSAHNGSRGARRLACFVAANPTPNLRCCEAAAHRYRLPAINSR